MTEDDKALVAELRINIPFEAPRCLKEADRIEAQAAEIKAILDREADTYRRHNAKVDALEAEIEKLREALAALIEQCRQCEKELTEAYYGVHYSGESEPLCKARAALGETKCTASPEA